MELLKVVSQNGQNYIFSFFLIFLKIEIPLMSLDRIKHITNMVFIHSFRKGGIDGLCDRDVILASIGGTPQNQCYLHIYIISIISQQEFSRDLSKTEKHFYDSSLNQNINSTDWTLLAY